MRVPGPQTRHEGGKGAVEEHPTSVLYFTKNELGGRCRGLAGERGGRDRVVTLTQHWDVAFNRCNRCKVCTGIPSKQKQTTTRCEDIPALHTSAYIGYKVQSATSRARARGDTDGGVPPLLNTG